MNSPKLGDAVPVSRTTESEEPVAGGARDREPENLRWTGRWEAATVRLRKYPPRVPR